MGVRVHVAAGRLISGILSLADENVNRILCGCRIQVLIIETRTLTRQLEMIEIEQFAWIPTNLHQALVKPTVPINQLNLRQVPQQKSFAHFACSSVIKPYS